MADNFVRNTSKPMDETKSQNNNINNNNKQKKKKSKSEKVCNLLKYTYVISVFILGFLLVIFKFLSSDFDDWLDKTQQDILDFFMDNNAIYIILVILVITLCKGVGVKDVLSLRVISVVIFAYKLVPNSKGLIFCLSVLIMGVLSSCSKLLEYRAIGKELQVVQGTPVKYVFKYIRKLLLFCIDSEDKIEWVDPKYTFDISETSRLDPEMDVYANFHAVIYGLLKGDEEEPEPDETERNGHGHGTERRIYTMFLNACVFIIVVIWASVIEWVQPITELFLYAHNWKLSARNIIIIILSEIADFDKMVEVVLIINSLYDNGDIIAGKIAGILFKPMFWMLGYLIVLPLSLLWAHSYHQKYLKFLDGVKLEFSMNEMNEQVPPFDRTTTPLLMDSEAYDNCNFPETESEPWKRFKYMHENQSEQKNNEPKVISVKMTDCRTNSTAL